MDWFLVVGLYIARSSLHMNQIKALISDNLHIYEIIILTTAVSILFETFGIFLSTSDMYILLFCKC